MANTLSPFGFSALNVVWNSTVGLTPVPGQQTLFTPVTGPEGILLKRISNIQEAVDTGGLYLYDTADPAKWAFVVGETLHSALKTATLGKCPKNTPVNGAHYDLVKVVGADSITTGQARVQVGTTSGGDPIYDFVDVRRIIHSQGDLIAFYTLENFFSSSATVAAMAVVCGATRGSGFSSIEDVTMSYMATIVPMDVPFKKFFGDILPAMMNDVPNDLKQFYASTYQATMNAFPFKDAKPTIAITTVWQGTSEVGVPVYDRPTQHYNGRAFNDGPVNAGVHPSLVRNGFNAPSGTADAQYDRQDRSEPIPNEFNATEVWQWLPPTSGNLRKMTRAGYPGSPWSSFTGFIHSCPYEPATYRPRQSGVVGGLHVGYLRDFHTLARSLIGGSRYALDTSAYPNLAALVISTLDEEYVKLGQVPTLYAQSQGTAAMNQVLDSDLGAPNTMFQQGTLVDIIVKFNKAWDTAAKEAAGV